jgi:acetamidase/formamidase
VLTIESGHIVTVETTYAAIEPAEVDQSGVASRSAVPEYTRATSREVNDSGPRPHILTGPIFVKGAMPGDVLEVRIQAKMRLSRRKTLSLDLISAKSK